MNLKEIPIIFPGDSCYVLKFIFWGLVDFRFYTVCIYCMEQSTERIWILIARKFSGDATAEELAELELLLLQSPCENYSMEILYDLWNSKGEQDHQYSENRYKELVLRMQHKGIDEGRFTDNEKLILNDTEPKRKRSKKWFLWFSSFLVIGLAGFVFLQNKGASERIIQPELLVKNEIKTTYGSKTNLVLPDGTKVWLNAGSKMTYDKEYGVNLREINLTGEAYFDVIKDPKKPFIIHTGKINIKVLGTAFNVRCYPDEKNTETSLVRGSLEVTMKEGMEKIILKPNEKLIVKNTENQLGKTNHSQPGKKINKSTGNIFEISRLSVLPRDSSIVETSWVNNKLVFRSETFEQVALKMEKWYAVSILFKDEKVKEKKFTGIFEKETIEQALNALQLITLFNYRIIRDTVFIKK